MKKEDISNNSTWVSVSIVMKFHRFLRIVPLPKGKVLALWKNVKLIKKESIHEYAWVKFFHGKAWKNTKKSTSAG